jgi:hypothetical protein
MIIITTLSSVRTSYIDEPRNYEKNIQCSPQQTKKRNNDVHQWTGFSSSFSFLSVISNDINILPVKHQQKSGILDTHLELNSLISSSEPEKNRLQVAVFHAGHASEVFDAAFGYNPA